MLCTQLTVGETGGTEKAVEFGKFWADNLDDATLKTFARLGILGIGDEVTSEPVHRIGDNAYVVFTPSPIKYVSAGIGAAVLKILSALFSWVKANPGKATLLGVSFAYLTIKIVDWQTKVVEAEVKKEDSDTIDTVLNNPEMTPDQKLKLILDLLGKEAGTDWGTIFLIGAGILGLAYVLGGKK